MSFKAACTPVVDAVAFELDLGSGISPDCGMGEPRLSGDPVERVSVEEDGFDKFFKNPIGFRCQSTISDKLLDLHQSV